MGHRYRYRYRYRYIKSHTYKRRPTMNFLPFKEWRSLLTVILGPCYSGKFVYEDAYQDDEYCCFYNKEDDLDSILSEVF